jgi:hypothetical protein
LAASLAITAELLAVMVKVYQIAQIGSSVERHDWRKKLVM